ncbi:MAG TPA: class I SAM-dependent methyltransferase [Firmicutes bacterium]|nr:class I SAM-dependent methyltransferase [Bacillota bacterium]
MKSEDNPRRPMEIPREAIEFRLSENPFLEIPYPDSTFDAVVITYAFHHIPHWQQPESIREMVRVLRPGGIWAKGWHVEIAPETIQGG